MIIFISITIPAYTSITHLRESMILFCYIECMKYLSVYKIYQWTNCGCSPFHPILGYAFLVTLAAGHPRAKPWYHQLTVCTPLYIISQYNSFYDAQTLLEFFFCAYPSCTLLPPSSKAILLGMLSLHGLIHLLPYLHPHLLHENWKVLHLSPFLLLEGSSGQPRGFLNGMLGTFGWQLPPVLSRPSMLPFIGVVGCSTTNPFLINWFSFGSG